MLHKAGLGLALLALLVLAGLLSAPYLIDLNDLKNAIANQVRERTGRTTEIAGPLRLTLLPGPSLGARDVRVANPPGTASPDMLKARAVEVKLAFWPLLAGRIEITSAALIEPEIDLEILPDGSGNWHLPGGAGAGPTARPGLPVPVTGSAPAIAIADLAIEDGTVGFRTADAVERFEHIDAKLALDSLAGPLRAEGSFVSHGAAVSFTAGAGAIEGEAMPVHATFATRPASRLEFDGTIGFQPGAPHLAGKARLSAPDFSALLGEFGDGQVSGVLAQPVMLSGELDAAPEGVKLDRLALDLGTSHGEGSLRVALAKPVSLDLALHIDRFDLDHQAARQSAAPALPVAPANPAATAAIPATGTQPAFVLALPRDLAAHFDIAIDALLWRGDIVRPARLQATLDRGQLAVSRLEAGLPGGASVRASGSLAADQGMPRFDGTIAADADDLRGLLRWLGISAGKVPPDRLRRATLAAHLAIAGDRLDLSAIDATLDATQLQGSAGIAWKPRLDIGLDFAIDRLNIDAYVPAAARAAPPAPDSGPRPAALADFDADVDIALKEATWRGQPLHDLRLRGHWQAGSLSLEEATVGDIGGAGVKLSGLVDGLSEGTPKGQIAFDMSGPELTRILRFAWPATQLGRSLGAFTLGGDLTAEDGKLSLDTDLKALGGHAHLAGALAGEAGLGLTLDVDHPSADQLLRNLLPAFHLPGDAGALKLVARFTGSGDTLAADNLALTIGDTKLAGRLGVNLAGANVAADLVLGGAALGGTVDLKAKLQGDERSDFAVHLGWKDADLAAALGAALAVSGVEGRLDLDATLAGAGSGNDNFLSTLAGDVMLHAHDGQVSGINLEAIDKRLQQPDRPPDLPALIKAVAGGSTPFTTLDARFHIANGVARSDNLHLAAPGGEGECTMSLDLAGWTIDTRSEFLLAALPEAPPLVVHLDGPLSSPRIVFDVSALSQYLVRRAQSAVGAGPSSPR